MKIAMIYPSLESVGGAENVVVSTAEDLARRGHEIVIFTRAFSDTAWGHRGAKLFKIQILKFSRSRSTLKMNAEAGRALSQAMSTYQFDVVNAHNYPASLWVYYAIQQTTTFPPVLIYLHNLTYNFYERQISGNFRKLPGVRNYWNQYRPKKLFRILRQALFRYRRLDKVAMLTADRILANSRYCADLASGIYGREVIPCLLGVSPDKFAVQGHPVRHVSGNNRKPTIMTVARIELQKNFDTILRAVALLKKRGMADNFKYIVAGAGPQLSYFKKKNRRMGLDDIVEFVGSVPHDRISEYYAEAAFLVHIPLDEPFGLVPLEAALMKKASIVSDHGGPSEIVVNGSTGLHVNALNPEDVADKIQTLLLKPGYSVQLGEAAEAWVRKHLTWERYVTHVEDQLRQVTGLHQNKYKDL
jgi:glycosyltransferase involved in cell wall biosynthesis